MNKKYKQNNNKLNINQEKIRELTQNDLADADGAGIHGTGTPTGLCCTNSQTCTHTK